MKTIRLIFIFFLGLPILNAQNCNEPDVSELELICIFQNVMDPYDLSAIANTNPGTWSVYPENASVFVYNESLFYDGTINAGSAGTFQLRFSPDTPKPNCPSTFEYDIELRTTVFVYPIPILICEGDSYDVDGIELKLEGIHDFYFQKEPCDSLVTYQIMYHDVCPEEQEEQVLEQSQGGTISTGTQTSQNANEDDGGNDLEVSNTAEINNELEIPKEELEEQEFELESQEIEDFQFPTAFSPDGNSINDSFGPVFSPELETYSIEIYNRWGNQVFGIGAPATLAKQQFSVAAASI